MKQDDLQAKNAKTALTVLGVVLFMIGLSFAAVPLYDMFCKVTGFGGTPQTSASLPDKILDRVMKVNFVTSTAKEMPWQFNAEQRSVNVRIGQDMLINFKAYNPTDKDMVGTAIYNVTPNKAGKYFHKTECFCFGRQILKPKQRANFPVIFYIDPAIADDPDMQDLTTITLSYTFFKSDSQDLEKALDAL
jgi:cytochrome c oxidase assembly protein subunit 11